jgi:hypothetical protein
VAGGEQLLELVLDLGGHHEQQLVARLERLLGLGGVDRPSRRIVTSAQLSGKGTSPAGVPT